MRKNNGFFSGKGISVLLNSPKINNLYRPTAKYGIETLDYVNIKGSFVKKFSGIVLKECFFLIKSKGYLIIDYTNNKDYNFQSLEEILWWLFKENYNIILHEKDKNTSRIVIQKQKSILAKKDNIEKWSFGIVTNGERDNWVKQIIESIQKLKIPKYEIIVCGKYKEPIKKEYTYIKFDERSEKGWITKKKNLICEKAKYENLCIIHDRLVFDKNWYKGMKKYGNAFELLGCTQIEKKSGAHAGDWLTLGGPIGTWYKIARIENTDWDFYTFLSGQLMIIKKAIWKKVLWNENMYWGGQEDADISFRARNLGYLIRFNPHSRLMALTWRFGNIPLKHDFSEGLLPKDMLVRRSVRFIGSYLSCLPYMKIILTKLYIVFQKIPFYQNFLYK